MPLLTSEKLEASQPSLVFAGQFSSSSPHSKMSQHLVALSSVRSIINVVFRQPKGDIAERLTCRVTVFVMALLSAVLITSHFWGEPITCWAPAEYTKHWIQFVNHYCYVQGTYYVPIDQPLPWDINVRRKVPITYYQWVPYLFAVQAFLYYLPKFVWKMLCGLCGVDMPEIIRQLDRVWHDVRENESSFQGRLRKFELLAAPFVWDSLKLYRSRCNGLPTLAFCYLFSKIIHAMNATVQWIWLNGFLNSHRSRFWGIDILKDLLRGLNWQDTGHFPRITQCDFYRRRPASSQQESIVCVLTLNVYYEKIFLFLWYWLAFVAIVNLISAIYWLWICLFPNVNVKLIRKYLHSTIDSDDSTTAASNAAPQEVVSHNSFDPDYQLSNFFNDQLRLDGVFVIRQVAVNIGHLPAAYLARAMFDTMALRKVPGTPNKVHSPNSPTIGNTSTRVYTQGIRGKGTKEV